MTGHTHQTQGHEHDRSHDTIPPKVTTIPTTTTIRRGGSGA